MAYKEDFLRLTNTTVDDVLMLARMHVPENRKASPWVGLNHGVGFLSTDDQLAQYLAAYGQMHKDKLIDAFATIQNPQVVLGRNMTIVDWGCGQGLAAMSLFDYMRVQGIHPQVDRVVLVEPSAIAIERAELHLSRFTSAPIVRVNKFINNVTASDITASEGSLVLHLFSDILDIESVDIDHLATLIHDNSGIEQLCICVGPHNAGTSRISEFAQSCGITLTELNAERNGLIRERGDISMVVFRMSAEEHEVINVAYYRYNRMEHGHNIALERLLQNLQPMQDLPKNVLNFYKTIVDLQKSRYSDVSDVYYYADTLDEATSRVFRINVARNQEFKASYDSNARERWPKNLYVGLSVEWNDEIYRLIELVYPFESLSVINTERESIIVDLSMFSVNSDVAETLELSNDVVDVISETMAKSDSTIEDLESILRDAINPNIKLDHRLALALTQEMPAMAQIQSELKSLLGREPSELMSSFLSGVLPNNVVDSVTEDELINVVPIDDSQRRAIARAFNSRVSVITGPPGTGKTQMIVNLLANALVRDKRVLVSSVVNKAVDNIKERVDRLDQYQYLLRFGSRELISNQLIPHLELMRNKVADIQFDNNRWAECVDRYSRSCKVIRDARKELKELESLQKEVLSIEQSIAYLEEKLRENDGGLRKKMEGASSVYGDIVEIVSRSNCNWAQIDVQIKQYVCTLESKNTWLGRILFAMFQKGKVKADILNNFIVLPSEIRRLIEEEAQIQSAANIDAFKQLIRFCNAELKYVEPIAEYIAKQAPITKQLENERGLLEGKNRRVATLVARQRQNEFDIEDAKRRISDVSLNLYNLAVQKHLTSPHASNIIARYRSYLPNNIPWKSHEVRQFVDNARNFVDVFRLNSVTSLSVKNAYPLDMDLFDMVIIDEASQCDIASALPLIYRAKQIVVVGDPLQLKHITTVNIGEEQQIKAKLNIEDNPFVKNNDCSLWDYCDNLITSASENNCSVMLTNHYRCHPHIIGYSNDMFYRRRFGQALQILTQDVDNGLQHRGIIWKDVVGEQESDTRNVNIVEAQEAISLAEWVARQAPNVSIGIITPFRHQAEVINEMIPAELQGRVIADTVYKFQGDERDVIIYSTVVTDNSPDSKIRWIDEYCQNLVNVAVTRARSVLYVVGNKEYIRTHSNTYRPLGYLVHYAESAEYPTMVLRERR